MNGKTIIFKKLTVKEKAGTQAGWEGPPPETVTNSAYCLSTTDGTGCPLMQPQPDCFTGGLGDDSTAANAYCLDIIIVVD